jgi:hypothetical protein
LTERFTPAYSRHLHSGLAGLIKPYGRGLLQERLGLRFSIVFELAGGDALGGAPVSLGDVVLEVVGPDAPNAPAPDLDSAKLPCLDEATDEAGLHIQLFGDLLDRQEAVWGRFIGHRPI